ncbi:hypothetical protein M2T29_28875, partial [Klebsiella pneumoniae]|uniref:hypothetical protein n=1 Tax=Klebsiella pneumoniae TaxID=573 RepID=UPI00200C0B56
FQTEYLKNKEQRDQKKFDKLKEGLRKQIANAFKANPIFSLLDKDDLFKGSKGAKGLIETWLDQNESIYENIFKSSGNKETIEEIKSNVKYGF